LPTHTTNIRLIIIVFQALIGFLSCNLNIIMPKCLIRVYVSGPYHRGPSRNAIAGSHEYR
jgi:hypothetical protein